MENGHFASDLGLGYRQYGRHRFIHTLVDWKWSGLEGEQPSLYTAENWS